MHLIAHGRIRVGSNSSNGLLLLTDQWIFVLKSTATATTTGVAVGGLLGMLIGRWIDKRKAMRAPAAHLQDPEIVGLDEKTRGQLIMTQLEIKLPLNQNLQVKPTRLGFEFNTPGQPPVFYSGWARKKKVRQFLADRSIRVDAA